MEPIGDADFDAAISAFDQLVPVDLEALVAKLDKGGIDSGIRVVGGKYDPLVRVERARSRPRAMRRLVAEGVTGYGQRNRAIYLFVRDCLFSGYTCFQAIERLIAWIEAGKLDASRGVQENGREWQIKQVERIVMKLYATIPALGTPDPIPLTSEEILEVKKIAYEVSLRSEYSQRRVKRFLLRALPWYKGAAAAGLPMLRMHCHRWESFDRDAPKLRALVGIFRAETGYRSMASVQARQAMGARRCEAHARSYSCRFRFRLAADDVPTYLLSTRGKRVVTSSFDMPIDPPSIFIATFQHSSSLPTDFALSTTPLPSLSASNTYTPTETQPLYVPHSQITQDLKGSDKQIEETKTTQEPEYVSPYTRRRRALEARKAREREERLSDPIAWAQKQAKKRAEEQALREARARYRERNKPEWKRLREWCPPGAENMTLDEYFDALEVHAKVVREYEREKGKAKSVQQKIFNATGKCSALRKLVSWRCIDLQVELGLEPWR